MFRLVYIAFYFESRTYSMFHPVLYHVNETLISNYHCSFLKNWCQTPPFIFSSYLNDEHINVFLVD